MSTAGGHVGDAETWEQWHQDADGIRTKQSDVAQSAKLGNVLVLPSEAEVEEHELTHLPFRNWCRHCVRAKCKESQHLESSTRFDASAIQELVQTLRTCQRQGKSAPRVESWWRVEVRHRLHVHG